MIKFKNKKVLLSSDLHINHTNYCSSTSRWENRDACRRFDSIDDMNRTILEDFFLLDSEDVLILLGDFLFGYDKDYYKWLDLIGSDNIYFVFGNHCNRKKFEENIHPKIKWYGDLLRFSIDGQAVIASHYPLLSWEDMNRMWMMHGHTHGELEYPKNFQDRLHYGYSPKIFDVGIDNYYKIHGRYSYFSWEELKNKLK